MAFRSAPWAFPVWRSGLGASKAEHGDIVGGESNEALRPLDRAQDPRFVIAEGAAAQGHLAVPLQPSWQPGKA